MLLSSLMLEHVVKQAKLSPRQQEIMSLLLQGYSDKQLAQAMKITVPTVRTHMGRLFAKMGAADRCELLVRSFALAHELCRSANCPLCNGGNRRAGADAQ